ncbi:uncharacterized protein LOC133891376 isoform X2 [Phragmites australis]|uniref:uncharacterized protein LOC133891376 isoform X2 n=1 Tax=Phragmites australis TaxID=29695 RepID=UPI002D78F7FF|nr:uncharacterized protein LOC133891376 isoform X2 [Phragmites australis]
MAPPVQPVLPRLEATVAPPTRQPPPLADEILEEIFLRIASPADLARASAACVSFRRLIADPSFLRRWQHCDVCDGRVLLQCIPDDEKDGVYFPDLAVCDPLSRRYLLLPPIPDDLVASAQVQEHKIRFFDAFLVPSGHEEEASFKVIGRTHCTEKLVVFIFSSGSSRWSVGTSTSWVDLSLNTPPGIILGWPHYEYGCFYWKVNWRNRLLKLDINRMEFSTVDLPPDHDERDVVIVEAGEGRLAMLSLIRNGTAVDYYTIMQNEGERVNEWLVENVIPLPCRCNFVGASEGYIFLLGVQKTQDTVDAVCFSLEIKTLKIERLSSIKYLYVHVHSYFGFPPFMSPRRI